MKIGYVDYLEKGKIDKLVTKVVSALAKYETRLIDKQDQKDSIPLFKWNLFKNRLFFRKYFISNIEILEESFVPQNKWVSDLELDASEQEYEYSYEYEDELYFAGEIGSETGMNLSISSWILPSLKSEINSKLTKKFSSTYKVSHKKAKKIRKLYKLQESTDESKPIIKKIYEHASVYTRYCILIKDYCRCCKSYNIHIIEAFKRIPYVKTRVRIYYTDNTVQIIDTELVSVF